jgi:nucleoside 2-deoxyribosyltransferase
MFNLLVKGMPWENGVATFGSDRVISHTDEIVEQKYTNSGKLDFDALMKLPSLFVQETNYQEKEQVARVGRVTQVRQTRTEVIVHYSFDTDCAPIPQDEVIRLKDALHLYSQRRGYFDELSTTHWAVKDVDLFRVLYSSVSTSTRTPKVFQIPPYQIVDKNLVSVMMPFAGFSPVYEAIKFAVTTARMDCVRADELWQHSTIIADIVSIIDRAAIVICDCTNKNANVFYEAGIAHALGKEVILITQNKDDIPFDLQQHRYIHYLGNAEGLVGLTRDLVGRINTLKTR